MVAVRDDELERTNHVVATDKYRQTQGAFVFFAASQPPARLCPSKCRESFSSVDFTPQLAHATLHTSSKGAHGPPPAARRPHSAPADPAARRLQVRPAYSLRRPRPSQPPRHPQPVSICPFATTARRAAAVLPAPARPSRRRLPPRRYARTHARRARSHPCRSPASPIFSIPNAQRTPPQLRLC